MNLKNIFLLLIFTFCTISTFARAEKVYVGMYLNDISDFNTKKGRFHADLYVWAKWMGTDSLPPLTFPNGEIETKTLMIRERENNWNSARWRVQGTFRGNFPLEDFPFDEQIITLQVELADEWGELVPDQAASSMSEKFSITGWEYDPYFKIESIAKQYSSDLGSIEHEGIEQEVHRLLFSLHLNRPFAANFIKLIIPLCIILMMATLAFFLTSGQLVVRNGMVVTALLSCVAFHFSQADSLPDVSYLVAADKFFLGAYFLIIMSLVGIVASFRASLTSEKLSSRIDKIFAISVPVGSIILGVLIYSNHAFSEEDEIESSWQNTKVDSVQTSTKDTLTQAVPVLTDLSINHHLGLIRRGLLYHDSEGNKVPHLLEQVPSMTNDLVRLLSNGGIEVTWRLKNGLKWGDGESIDAQDLKFSLKVEKNENIKEIKTLDDYTIRVSYKKRDNDILNGFMVYPQHSMENTFKNGGLDSLLYALNHNPPPMDGPYILKSFKPEEKAVFEKNPYFAGADPAIPVVISKVFKKEGKMLSPQQIIRNKEADLIALLSLNSYNSLQGLTGYNRHIDSLSGIQFILQPNTMVPPFHSKTARKAISLAINRKTIAMKVDSAAGCILQKAYKPMYSECEKHNYDLKKAQELLTTAGVNTDTTIHLYGYSRGIGAPEHFILTTIKNNLETLGFTTKLHLLENPADMIFKDSRHNGILYYETDQLAEAAYWNSGYNHDTGKYIIRPQTNTVPKEVVELFHLKRKTMFPERKKALETMIQDAFDDYLPTIPIYEMSFRSVTAENLRNYAPMHNYGQGIWWNAEYLYFDKKRTPEGAL